MARWMLAACGVAVAPAARLGAESEISLPGCVAPAGLESELVEPPALGRSCVADADCWRSGIERARTVRDRYPDAYDAHRAYVLDVRAGARFVDPGMTRQVANEYEAEAARHPDNPAYGHLLAQLSLEGDVYRKQLDELIERAPGYPWAHLSRAFLGRTGAPEELVASASSSLERFVEICPGRLVEIGRALEIQSGGEPVEPRLEELRRRALDRRDLAALETLWRLESHFADASTANEARARIAEDLTAFERPGIPADLDSLPRLAAGHALAGDEAGRVRIEDRLLELHPCDEAARALRASRYADRFAFDGALPGADREPVSPDAIALIDSTLAACPQDTWALARRIQTLRRQPGDRISDLVDAVDRIVAAGAERNVAGAWPELWRAELWLDLGIRLDRVPGLLEADRSASEQEDGASEGGDDSRSRRRARLEARLAAAKGDLEAARAALSRAGSGLEGPGAAGSAPSLAEVRDLDLARAEVDRASGQPLLALGRLEPWLEESPAAPQVERQARAAWKEAHPGESGYADWRASVSRLAATGGSWQVVDYPFPQVPVRDLSGTEWRFPDPSGRTVFLRTWSAWCVPCRQEIAVLQRLSAEFAEREDVAFVQLSVDRSPGEVIEYLARSEPAFDVLTGGHELLGHGIDAIPSTWIVDRGGRVVRIQVGSAAADPEVWLEAAREALRAVAGPAPGEAPAE